jgi:hypothetical protein
MSPLGVTGDDLFAQVLMLRTADPRTIVLLESSADCQAIDAHVDDVEAQTIPGYSKTAVEKAIQLADAAPLERVLAILDLDWVGLLDQPLSSLNIIYTDRYDLDATIFLTSDVMTRIVSATTDRDNVDSHLKSTGLSMREIVLRIAGKIGIGRFVSCRDKLEVSFRDFPVHVVLMADQDDVDVTQMVTTALGRARTSTIAQADFVARVRKMLTEVTDLSQYSSGHDIAAALAQLVKGPWRGSNVSRVVMEQFGRAALSCAALEQTMLYASVTSWARESGTRVWNCG